MGKADSARRSGLTDCRPESLERRLLLSASKLQGPVASAAAAAWYQQRVSVLQAMPVTNHAVPAYELHRVANALPLQTSRPDPAGLTPSQIKSYYGFNGLQFGSTAANGAGQTIAVIEAYDDPNLAADLNTFDTAYGLVAPPSFQVVSQTGSSTALPAPDTGDPVSGSWATEESLDVEWAHALAPGANIMVVECNSQNDPDLYAGVAYAAAAPGVSIVSMSFGQSENNYTSAEVAAIDPTFVTPPGHQGVTFLASSGDGGAYADGGPLAVSFPSSAPGVVSVGGTTLALGTTGNPVSESAWSGSGGGLSSLEPQTTAQRLAIGAYSGRANPDVSFDADPMSGVNLVDSLDFSAAAPFTIFGGTSFSSPAWGSILAIANQGRVIHGRSTLEGRQQTIPALYSAYSNGSYASVFNDVTTGDNGFYSAGKGYDLATGLGSPKVKTLVPQLVSNTVNSKAPTIGSFTINPEAENAGTGIVLSASGVTDTVGNVVGVSFYRLQGAVSTLLGKGAVDASGNWNLPVKTAGLKAGTYTYAAIATNNFRQNSARVSTTNKVVTGQATPTIGSLIVQPGSVPVGTDIVLVATKVADTTSAIASVRFYLDTAPTLIFVGNGTNRGGGKWTLTTGTGKLTPGSYHYLAIAVAASGIASSPSRAIENIRLAPPVALLVNTAKDQIDTPGSKTVSLRDAIAVADRGIAQVTIDFDPKVFAVLQTIVLSGTTLSLTNTAASTLINGPAAGLAISGNGSIEVFSISPEASVAMSNLTITDGASGGSGAGLSNAGIATLTNVTVSKNIDTGLVGNGGGIENDGTLTLINSTITGNTSKNGNGGGLYNTGQLTAVSTTISGNTAFNGGGLGNDAVLKLTDSAVSGNTAFSHGGGIDNSGTLSVISSTISGNTADDAGGLYNAGGYQGLSDAVATVTNSTIAENAATSGDGGIKNGFSGQILVNDSTIAMNASQSTYGGLDNVGTATVSNSIIAGNSAAPASTPGVDVNGQFDSQGHNLIGQADGSSGWIQSDYVGSNVNSLNAHLSPLGYFGGAVATVVPLAGSQALGHGSTALIPGGVNTDERGYARIVNKKVDIGAVQLQRASPLKLTAPPAQSAQAGQSTSVKLGSIADLASNDPFIVVVNWGDGSTDTSTSDHFNGTIAPELHTFQTLGNLVVSVAVSDRYGNVSNLATFPISVKARPPETLMVNTAGDQIDPVGSNTISLRDAVSSADHYFGSVTIGFDPKVFASQKTIALAGSDLEITNAYGTVAFTGPAAGVNISGGGKTNVLLVDADAKASLNDLTIMDGTGGIINYGNLSVMDCTVSGNTTTSNGAGINNFGILTLLNSTFAGNISAFSTYSTGPSGDGGALFNSGDATLTNVTMTGNTAYYGAGIDNIATVTITNSIVAADSITGGGSGGTDVVGIFNSKGHNLIGNTAGSNGWLASDLTGSAVKPLNPHLSALGNNGGPTQTAIPLRGSAAINNGTATVLPAGITTDQRGKPRTINGKVDIGAVQV